jgi:hypothetical protein
MAGKGHKAKKNETSFEVGNTAAEKWPFARAEAFFKQALIDSETCLTLNKVARAQGEYKYIFDYLCEKYPVFAPIKKEILANIEDSTYIGALNGDYNPATAIFGLKHNHKWTDANQTDITSGGQPIKLPAIKIIDTSTNSEVE